MLLLCIEEIRVAIKQEGGLFIIFLNSLVATLGYCFAPIVDIVDSIASPRRSGKETYEKSDSPLLTGKSVLEKSLHPLNKYKNFFFMHFCA